MHLLDRLGCLLLRGETDEREASWAARVSIDRDVNVHDLPDLGQQLAELLIGDAEVEITYEYFV